MIAAKILLRNGGIKTSFLSGKQNFGRLFKTIRSEPKSLTIKERLMSPTNGLSTNAGKGLLAGASLTALGGLCYYGMGLSKERGAIDTYIFWPQIVRDRIKTTYQYFGGSVFVTAATSVMAYRSKPYMNLCKKSPYLAIGGLFVGGICSLIACVKLPYHEGFGSKQVAFTVFTVLEGLSLAPLLAIYGGPLVVRAACYTAGIIGGLSAMAVCAPSDKFLYLSGPLCMGLGVVIVSSLGAIFFPVSTAIGAGLKSITLYGGLVLFGGFLLHDTQKIIEAAKKSVTSHEYDPINQALNIYLDAINIFIRVLELLGNNNKKK